MHHSPKPAKADGAMPATATSRPDTIQALCSALEQGLFERSLPLRLAIAAAVAGESVFFLGPPGVAKSLLARRLQAAFAQARCFDYLMGRFSTPEEVFGPISIRLLKSEDRYERQTEGYLPDADIVFLDEIWKASPPIQNALLTALNEKVFRNGQKEIRLPLKCLIAASNELPADEASKAFWDRFLVRIELGPLQSSHNFIAMLEDSTDALSDPVPPDLKIERTTWEHWQEAAIGVALDGVAKEFLVLLRQRWPGCGDRRWKKAMRLLRALAFLDGRTKVGLFDCLALRHVLWDTREQRTDLDATLCEVLGPALEAWLGLDSLKHNLALYHEAAERARWQETVHEGWQADLVDDEYFTVRAPSGMQNQTLRIWQGDYEILPYNDRLVSQSPGSSLNQDLGSIETLAVDIFFYEDGRFVASRPIACARGPQGALLVGTSVYQLEGAVRQQSSRQRVSVASTDPELQNIQARAEAEYQAASTLLAEVVVPTMDACFSASFFLPHEDAPWVDQLSAVLAKHKKHLIDTFARLRRSLQSGADAAGTESRG